MRSATLTLAALAIGVAGCGDGHDRDAEVSSMPSGPVVQGASATVPIGHGHGQLDVRVSQAVPSALGKVRVEASRQRCDLKPVADSTDAVADCHTAWHEHWMVPLTSFTLSPGLAAASLTTECHGRPLAISWHASGHVSTLRGEVGDSYLALQSTDATSSGTWGAVRWTHRQYLADRDAGTTMYRRVLKR